MSLSLIAAGESVIHLVTTPLLLTLVMFEPSYVPFLLFSLKKRRTSNTTTVLLHDLK
jgi:hypothetical protein